MSGLWLSCHTEETLSRDRSHKAIIPRKTPTHARPFYPTHTRPFYTVLSLSILQQQTIPLPIQQLPHLLNWLIQGGRSAWFSSVFICVCVCVSVLNYLSSIVLDAKLVVIHSGLHVVRVRLRRKDSDLDIPFMSAQLLLIRLSKVHCA